MHKETIEAFNEFTESAMKLFECIKNEIIDFAERFADALDEIVEIIEETINEKETTSKRQQYIESYKKSIKDYLIVFEILKIPIIKIPCKKKETLKLMT